MRNAKINRHNRRRGNREVEMFTKKILEIEAAYELTNKDSTDFAIHNNWYKNEANKYNRRIPRAVVSATMELFERKHGQITPKPLEFAKPEKKQSMMDIIKGWFI